MAVPSARFAQHTYANVLDLELFHAHDQQRHICSQAAANQHQLLQ